MKGGRARGSVVALVAGLSLFLVPSGASAVVSGPCTASLAGEDVTQGRDEPGTAIDVDVDDVVSYSGEATGGQTISDVALAIELLGANIKLSDFPSDGSTWSGDVEVGDYAWAGVGLYRVRGTALGESGQSVCTGTAYVCVGGRLPFLTVAGGVASAIGLVALYLIIRGLFKRSGSSRAGLGTRFGSAGVLGGVAAAVLLQQFCVLPLTSTSALVSVLGGFGALGFIGILMAGGRGAAKIAGVRPDRRERTETIYRFVASPGACTACRNHAAHRVYESADAIAGDRAHPGCKCEIRSEPSDRAAVVAYFQGGRNVYDDRGT